MLKPLAMEWTSPMFNSIIWTTTALIPSIVAEEWELVVIRAGFQVERAAHAMLGTEGKWVTMTHQKGCCLVWMPGIGARQMMAV